MGDETDPAIWIRRAAESGLGVRFARGVVGKTGHAMIALLIGWLIIFWRLNANFVQDAFLVGAGIVATGVFVWWANSTQKFAERNPGQALMDGAQFLEYRKFEVQAKGLAAAAQSPLIGDPTASPIRELPTSDEADV